MQIKVFVLVVCALLIATNATTQVQAYCVNGQDNCRLCTKYNRKCMVCDQNYNIKNGKCVPCHETIPRCKNCSRVEGICLECNSGYFLKNGKCQSCSQFLDNCQTCGVDGQTYNRYGPECTVCYNGFSVADGKCVWSPDITPACFTCDENLTHCKPCNESNHPFQPNKTFQLGNKLEFNGKTHSDVESKSSACPDNYKLSADNSSCVPMNCTEIDANCEKCQAEDNSVCETCKENYHFDNTGKCVESGNNDFATYSVTYFVSFALLLTTATIVA